MRRADTMIECLKYVVDVIGAVEIVGAEQHVFHGRTRAGRGLEERVHREAGDVVEKHARGRRRRRGLHGFLAVRVEQVSPKRHAIAQFLPRAEVFVVTTPQPAAQRVAQRAAAMADKVNLQVRGVIENMSWFTGDDGKRYEIFGAGGGRELAEKLEVPLVGQVPLLPDLREGSDIGRPVVAIDPDGEAGRAFAAIAEEIDVALAPKRRYNAGLTLIDG